MMRPAAELAGGATLRHGDRGVLEDVSGPLERLAV